MGSSVPAPPRDPQAVAKISWKLITALATGIGVVAALATNMSTLLNMFTPSVAGQWELTTTTTQASVPRYINLPLTYDIAFSQTGRTVSGKGYKVREGGKDIPPNEQQPMEIEGEISGGSLSAQYTLKPGSNGLARETMGSFQWRIVRAGVLSMTAARLEGTFSAQVADSSGKAVAVRP